ncbi:hypothetical protein NP233_g539 [Leucocoprinus birnbaumii]|uniref:Uncharacterized protein n=1 Tax=Leucocoprinus birnbaumii TaxID=56174 RepID=A0AAD5YWL9_9AGAR|nr:hypothetical protein NP233_g539 [Leucocoprinus birnbaumii]
MPSANTTSQRSASRPLPRPPGAAPPYEPAPLQPPQKQPPSPPSTPPAPLPSSSPPTYSTFINPPSPKLLASSASPPKRDLQRSFVMQNPPPKLSPAQQLYASSFTNRGPSVPSLPPPSLHPPNTTTSRQSFYKTSVASHVQPSPPFQQPRSPASTISSLSLTMSPQMTSSPTTITSFVPQSPPYSERSFSDEGPQANTAYQNNMPHLRSRTEPDGPFRSFISSQIHDQQTASHPNRNTVYGHSLNQPTRTLFDLKYVNAQVPKPKEVRNLKTLIKPPPGSGESGVAQSGNHTSSTLLPQSTVSPPPNGPITFGAPIHPPDAAAPVANVSMPTARPAAHVPSPPPLANTQSSPGFISPPPPPPLPNTHSQHQQPQLSPVRPQTFVPSHSPPVQQPQQPPHQSHQPPQPPQPQYAHQQQQSQFSPQPQPPLQPQYTTQHQYQQAPQQQQYQHPQASQAPNKPAKQSNGLLQTFASGFANELGHNAAKIGTQALLSSLGLSSNDDDDDDDDSGGGIFDLFSGGGGDSSGGNNDPTSTTTAVDYVPVAQDPGVAVNPGACYVPSQGPGVVFIPDYQPTFTTNIQSTSYNFELGGGNNNNGGDGNGLQALAGLLSHVGHNNGHSQSNQLNNHIPPGAQQPHLSQYPALAPHQAQPPGYNPYQYH